MWVAWHGTELELHYADRKEGRSEASTCTALAGSGIESKRLLFSLLAWASTACK